MSRRLLIISSPPRYIYMDPYCSSSFLFYLHFAYLYIVLHPALHSTWFDNKRESVQNITEKYIYIYVYKLSRHDVWRRKLRCHILRVMLKGSHLHWWFVCVSILVKAERNIIFVRERERESETTAAQRKIRAKRLLLRNVLSPRSSVSVCHKVYHACNNQQCFHHR